MQITDWKKWFSSHREVIFRDFFTFLRFKSIATDPEFDSETKQCADWLKEYLTNVGMRTKKWESSGQPVIFAEAKSDNKNAPTLLVYQHYDVQPVDPLELWKSDPFEPEIRKGQVFARGAQDNKGQCFYTITAIKAFLEYAKQSNFNLKLFIEGEEESGSMGTREVLKKHKDALKSDYLLVVDSGIPAPESPAITLGMRGILTIEIEIQTADQDLHSGAMGGIAYNPIRALAHALSQCWDEEGKIAIPHFYDDVEELTAEERKHFAIDFDEQDTKKRFGLRATAPEPGYTISESATIRPTFEINGISGGYTGEGFKTVLPAKAKAKVSCRLVPKQDPEEILTQFKKYFRSHLTKGIDCTIEKDHGSVAFRSPQNSLIAKRAAKAYEDVLGKPCESILVGGSIPITTELVEASGAEAVMIGYGIDDDNVHAPNEHFGVDRFEQGFLTMLRIFEQFHEQENQ